MVMEYPADFKQAVKDLTGVSDAVFAPRDAEHLERYISDRYPSTISVQSVVDAFNEGDTEKVRKYAEDCAEGQRLLAQLRAFRQNWAHK